MEKYTGYYNSPIGLIEISVEKAFLISLQFVEIATCTSENSVIKIAINQLDEYFNRKRKIFELPIKAEGTEFQKKVWEVVKTVTYGHTSTYRKIAIQLGNIKCIRAVGTANGKNPLPIIIPCHRIIGENNTLIGYSGGLWRKKWLLEHETGMLSF